MWRRSTKRLRSNFKDIQSEMFNWSTRRVHQQLIMTIEGQMNKKKIYHRQLIQMAVFISIKYLFRLFCSFSPSHFASSDCNSFSEGGLEKQSGHFKLNVRLYGFGNIKTSFTWKAQREKCTSYSQCFDTFTRVYVFSFVWQANILTPEPNCDGLYGWCEFDFLSLCRAQ